MARCHRSFAAPSETPPPIDAVDDPVAWDHSLRQACRRQAGELPATEIIGTPIDWDTTQPHPFHGPADDLPRAADGSIPRYYYLSPEEIVRLGLGPPDLGPDRRRFGTGLGDDAKARFLDALAAAGTVSGACGVAGINRMAAYRERNRPDAVAFREAWDMAVRATVRILTDSVLERAIEGVEEPVFHQGVQCGTRRRFNERLTIFLLRTLDPETFGQARDRPVAIPARQPGLPPALAAVSGPAPAHALDVALDRVENREEGQGAAAPQITRTRVTSVTDRPAAPPPIPSVRDRAPRPAAAPADRLVPPHPIRHPAAGQAGP